jgi:hypothetical protein
MQMTKWPTDPGKKKFWYQYIHQGNANENRSEIWLHSSKNGCYQEDKRTMGYDLTPVRMTTIKKNTKDNKCWWGCRGKETVVDNVN